VTRLNFDFKLGTSTGHGETPTQDVAEWTTGAAGASWSLNGIDEAAPTSARHHRRRTANLALDWIFGLQNLDIEDTDKWGQVDAELFFDDSVSARWNSACAWPTMTVNRRT
jgi:iron complex outermembrane receptor protein